MNRQYIGARYVPTFANPIEWDKLRGYEAMTIVTYQGTSYTSKIPVPAGVELDNEKYWVVTGNYNAQVEQYRQEVDLISDRINDADSKINLMTDKKILFMGDSYNRVHEGQGWDVYCTEALGLNKLNNYYLSSGGYSFTRDNYKFITLLETHVNDISNKDKYTDIIICGGANEDTNQNSMTSAIKDFKTYCKSIFPNAKLHVGFIGWSGINSDKTRMIKSRDQYITACQQLGIHYLHNVEFVMHNYKYLMDNRAVLQNDYLHPTIDGCKALGYAIAQAFLCGSCTVHYEEKISVESAGATEGSATGNGVIICENGIITIRLDKYFMCGAMNVNRGDSFNIGKFTSNLLRSNDSCPFFANIEESGSTYVAYGNITNVDNTNNIYITWRSNSLTSNNAILMFQLPTIDTMRN